VLSLVGWWKNNGRKEMEKGNKEMENGKKE